MSLSVPVSNQAPSVSGALRLLFGVSILVVLESVAYQAVMSLDDLFPQLAGVSIVYRPDVYAVHQLLKTAVGAGLLWLLLFGREFYLARSQYLNQRSVEFALQPWLLHLLALALLLAYRGSLNGILILPATFMQSDWTAPAYSLIFAGFVATSLCLLAPAPFWRQYLFSNTRRLLVWTVGTALLAGLSAYGLDPVHLERTIMPWLFHVTAHGAAGVLEWLGYHALVNPATSGLMVEGFEVLIGPACLGYEGATLALLVLAAYAWWYRSRLRPAAAWLVLAMPLLLYGVNILRIAALMVIGASWSPDVAVHGFHSAAGWVNLLLVLGMAVWAMERLPLFARQPTALVPDLEDYKVQLLPQVVLIAVSMLTLLVNPGFDWAYPVRVIIVGMVLLQFWPRFQLQRPQRVLPIAVGAAVFGLWLAMVPVDEVQSSKFAQTLWSIPSGWAMAWIVMRMLGACVVVPLAEELAFRGAVFRLLGDGLHKLQRPLSPQVQGGVVLLLSSLAFGVLHGDWVAGTLAGLAYGLLRWHSGRISDAVVAHSVTNMLLGLYAITTGSWSLW